ncbi:glycosyltransferase family 4 protein [Aestuariicella hydrocarbonica]|uniref:Glycosyltransferase family 4 protein n=1 Tax=Pseudomaricurvus hydrocarbonicus TaxID=1470433 RepID=A0A9E5MJT9_9GAMM|nr:glycosyltransferase family 4 protein [Aestuariicella hydrocarbonica]NHO64462.1 glycosyltransferase family 4 protein [Aestuariicella hydrocarbonica]
MTTISALYYLLGFAGAAFSAYLLTQHYIHYALHKGVVDTPNDRSSHTTPTPRGGGVSIVIVSLALFAVALMAPNLLATQLTPPNLIALLLGGFIVAAIGFLDDLNPLSSKIRFSVHFIASLAALSLIEPLPTLPLPGADMTLDGIWLIPVALGLTWLINLYNFMDGIDGIAATEALTVLAGAITIGIFSASASEIEFPWEILALLTAPLLGFLLLNWSPAKVFMGDGCSGFLGITLGLLAVIYAANTPVNLWCWIILLGVFITDACWTLATRIVTKQKWHQPHRSHCYQILSRKLQSHRQVTSGAAAINLMWLTPLAVFASRHPEYGALFTLLAFTPLMLLCHRHQAGLHN